MPRKNPPDRKPEDPDKRRSRDAGRVTAKGHVRKGRTRAEFLADIRIDPTPEIVDKIISTIRKGLDRKVARQKAGVGPTVWARWISEGTKRLEELDENPELGHNVFSDLVTRMDEADGSSHEDLVTGILQDGDARVRLDYVRRRWSDHYSPDATKKVDRDTGQTEKINTTELLTAKLRELFNG